MDVAEQLNEAIQRRIARENAFKQEIKTKINAIIANLRSCDNGSASPEVTSAINLTQEQLTDILKKINDHKEIDDSSSTNVANEVKNPLLRRVQTSSSRRHGLFDDEQPTSELFSDRPPAVPERSPPAVPDRPPAVPDRPPAVPDRPPAVPERSPNVFEVEAGRFNSASSGFVPGWANEFGGWRPRPRRTPRKSPRPRRTPRKSPRRTPRSRRR